MIKKEKLFIVLLMLYTFVVIYTPNFFQNAYINYMLPFVYMIISFIFLGNIKKTYSTLNKKYYTVLILIGCWVFAAIFFALRALIAGVSATDVVNLRIVQAANMIAIIICICNIDIKLTTWQYSSKDKLKFLLNVAMIQAVIVIIMLIFPNLREIALKYFYQYGNGNHFTMEKRVYGIMLNYTFATPVFHGILATLACACAITHDKKMYLYIPFLILMIVLNGRTGLLVCILGFVINFIYFIFRKEYRKKMFIGIAIVSIFALISLMTIKLYNEKTYNFMISGVKDVINYFIGNGKSGNIAILSEQFTKNINLETFIFGSGHKIQNKGDIPDNITFDGVYSDMGYLNDMYMGGIIYMIMLYLPLFFFIIAGSKLIKKDNRDLNNILMAIAIMTVLACNIKGEVFRASIIIGGIIFAKIILLEDINVKERRYK